MADSYYEYLIKLHVFTGGARHSTPYGFRRMWDELAVKMRAHSIRTSGDLIYPGELHGGRANNVVDHLACFSSGMFALAAASADGQNEDATIARGIGATCVRAYESTASGLAAEVFMVSDRGTIQTRVAHNLLRPETVESLYVLYRLTGDQKYREEGWKIFQAFERSTRVENGYSGITNVDSPSPHHDNKQQSFFMAETLKYLYLLFSPSTLIPLDRYVFNTEAHPFEIPTGSWEGLDCYFPRAHTNKAPECDPTILDPQLKSAPREREIRFESTQFKTISSAEHSGGRAGRRRRWLE